MAEAQGLDALKSYPSFGHILRLGWRTRASKIDARVVAERRAEDGRALRLMSFGAPCCGRVHASLRTTRDPEVPQDPETRLAVQPGRQHEHGRHSAVGESARITGGYKVHIIRDLENFVNSIPDVLMGNRGSQHVLTGKFSVACLHGTPPALVTKLVWHLFIGN